jgi:hypothetical protein
MALAQFIRQNENRIPKKVVNMDLKRKYLRGRPRFRCGMGKKSNALGKHGTILRQALGRNMHTKSWYRPHSSRNNGTG